MNDSIIIDMNSEQIKSVLDKMNWREFEPYQKEQFAYRSTFCKTCIENKKCDICNCNVYDALSDILSCNKGKRFPKLLVKKEWETFKLNNNIQIK